MRPPACRNGHQQPWSYAILSDDGPRCPTCLVHVPGTPEERFPSPWPVVIVSAGVLVAMWLGWLLFWSVNR